MEIGGLRWDEISDEGINLPASRDKEGKARIIPLSTAARTILDSIERRGEYVFERQQRGVTRHWLVNCEGEARQELRC